MRIQLPGEFLKRPRACLFLLYSLGVLGVGSELVIYLPVNIEPPDLDCMLKLVDTGAIDPALVAPTDAFSMISFIFMTVFPISNFYAVLQGR